MRILTIILIMLMLIVGTYNVTKQHIIENMAVTEGQGYVYLVDRQIYKYR